MDSSTARHRLSLARAAAAAVGVAVCLSEPASADTFASVQHLVDSATSFIARSYQRSPAAVAVAAAGLALPVLGTIMLISRRIARALARRHSSASIAEAPSVQAGPAWLEVDGPSHSRVLLRAELCRIGRDADNDLTVTGPGIAATHAVIQRTAEREYLLVDVSGDPAAGLLVNGARCRHATLADGDRIGFGRAAVTFRNRSPLPLRTAPPTVH